MLVNLDKAPFPWFGGKSHAASLVWRLLGDVEHYCEPFAGSLAVLLQRPHPCNRPYHSETCNDLDGFVVNAWRSIQWHPVETAEAASWPVTEADKQARQVSLLRWKAAGGLDRLAGDACWCDPLVAGWWLWALAVHIGAFDGRGAWTADPHTGRLYKQRLGGREPGVRRDLPQIGDNGRGVNRQGTREPGVTRDLPHISSDGRGVNHAGLRQPGVLDTPTPEHGRSALDADWGEAFHDLTMPELIRWFRYLSARLRHVRILNGDWTRLVTDGALRSLSVREGGTAGLCLDPPYAGEANRDETLYHAESLTVANDVRDWCVANGTKPWLRVVLAGFEDGDYARPLLDAGWTEHEWFAAGHLRGGYGNVGGSNNHQQARERLWASPACLGLSGPTLWDYESDEAEVNGDESETDR